ncbi:MAG TPA: carbon-nitrogen hydrolase family protein [Polyangiaceae bacterium]
MQLLLINPTLVAGAHETNLATLRDVVAPFRGRLGPSDLALLPEHHYFGPWEDYVADMRELALWLGSTLVAGSMHRQVESTSINTGAVFSSEGAVVTLFEKIRPYASEREHVSPGSGSGQFSASGRRVRVMICADFWFTDLLVNQPLPDLVLVPALSVTRKPTPEYSRALWRHTAVARAYEYGVFVGISDWSADSVLPRQRTSGVSGFADPTPTDPEQLFHRVETAALIELDFSRLDAFRADRSARGFYWGGPPGEGSVR